VKGTTTGTYYVSFVNSGSDRSIISPYTISVANTWEKKVITFAVAPTAGTWDYINGIGVTLRFCLVTGTTFQTATIDAWQTGNFRGTSSQTNLAALNTNNIYFAQVQLEAGDKVSEFDRKDIAQEILDCQRYYAKTYEIDVAPGTASTLLGQRYEYYDGVASAQHFAVHMWPYPVAMRAIATITGYSPVTGASGKARDIVNNSDVNTTMSAQSKCGTKSQGQQSASGVSLAMGFHITADAEL
jgi:hypothetical protein